MRDGKQLQYKGHTMKNANLNIHHVDSVNILPRKEGCWQDIEIKLDDTVKIHRDKDGTEHEITMGGDTFVITLFSKHPVKMLIGKD